MNREAKALRDYLKEKRDQEGIQQKDQAVKLGITPAELARYTTGKREIKKDLQKIIDTYGTTPEEKRAIYRTQVSEKEIERAKALIVETRLMGGFQVGPIDLVVWIKHGI